MINFRDTEIAFRDKNNKELRKARILFKCMGQNWLVNLGKFASETAVKLHIPIAWALKPTIYSLFVGGENLQECIPVAQRLQKYKIWSIFDNSVEGGGEESFLKSNFEEAIRSINFTAENEKVAYSVFKPTALAPPHLLEKASKREILTEEEEVSYNIFMKRFDALCKKAYEMNIRILIDAEEYRFQSEIDRLSNEAMRKYNKVKPIVFSTLQMYRHDRMDYLKYIYDDAEKNNYHIGAKFVRGAYMEKERLRAKEEGYQDPICANKEETDNNFNKALKFAVDHIDRIGIFCGTHNEYSNKLLTELQKSKGISKEDNRIFYAQLYGMSDNLSYNLADAGYNVAKYVPYAPVNSVLPYLIRRAQENTAMTGQTSRELELINIEMKRRKTK